MVVVRQRRNDVEVGGYSPRPHSRRHLGGHHEGQPQERWKQAPTSAGYVQDEHFIEHLWETEGFSALKTTLHGRERNRKTEKDDTPHGHGIVGMGQLPDHLHHHGHFTPAHPNLNPMSKIVLDQGGHRAHPARACCGDFVTDETSDIDAHHGDGNVQEQYRGLQHFGGKEGARPPSQAEAEHAECFNSSFDLLSIEPRKLRTGFMSRSGRENVEPVATTAVSPCLPVDPVHASCGSLQSSSPGRHPTQANVPTLHDNAFCDGTIPTHRASPPGSPFGCPLKTPHRPISAPQNHRSTSALTCAEDDHSSSCQYDLCGKANARSLPESRRDSTHSTTNQVRNLDICNEFPDSVTRPAARAVAEALKTAHQETLCKARNPNTATRLDNMKASILCHAFYPRLVQAYIRRCRVGASPEIKQRLRDLQAHVQDWSPPNVADFNANDAVSKFHSMITAHEEDLETPFQRSMSFCDTLEKELEFVESASTRTTSARGRRISQDQQKQSTP